MRTVIFPVALLFVTVFAANIFAGQQGQYDFRKSAAYAALSAADRGKVDQVDRDLTLLWGALDRYADDHGGAVPESLNALVPIYLKELPSDPFATGQRPANYSYRSGSTGNRAWDIYSVGLPDFPYLAATGNVGLYRCKGIWISGINPLILSPATRPSVDH